MIEHELKYSLDNNKVISIIYMKDMDISQRRIQVLKLEKETVKAIDIDKGAIRTFKTDRILSAMNLKIVSEKYSKRGYGFCLSNRQRG